MGGTPVTPQPQSNQGLTLAQIQQMGATPVEQPKAPGIISSTISQVKNDLNAPGTITAPVGKGIFKNGQQAESFGNNALQATADVFGAVGKLPVLKQIGEVFGKGINITGDELSKLYTPEFQKSLDDLAPEDYAKATQPLKNLQNLGTIANTILMAKGGQKGTQIATNAIKDTVTSDITPKGPDIASPEVQAKLQGVANDWAKPSTINEPKYNNARAVLEKDPEAPKTLAQNGINPFEHIEDGKYSTEDTAQKLRDDNGKLSRDLLRPSLEIADQATPKTVMAELKPAVDDTYGVTPDDAEAIQTRLTSKLGALGRKYPEGMSLTNMLDERITYDKNGGYKAFKSNADNIDAIANRAIADTIRTTLETKGDQAGVPVSDFQAELAKNYKAADYLDALHGKKAPVSLSQSIARYGAKITGAKLAGMVGGGDIVSEFVGYHIGGALEKFVENMTNPMRDSFLKNLEKTNPPAFVKIEAYLKENSPPR